MAHTGKEERGHLPTSQGRAPMDLVRDIFRWDPLAEMAPGLFSREPSFVPRFEVREKTDAWLFKADLPGVRKEDLEIAVAGQRLSISGHREEEKKEEGERRFAWECEYGHFSRSFTLPEGIDAEQIDAQLEDGVLSVTLPKKPEIKPRKIPIGGHASTF